ncbi:Protein transport protein S9 plasma membrane t-SNARE [Coemansia sp. RSA 2337]|nr:Protein transport protein S9 plasma membrane t-SNARE [Coemansia sp. S680]KAJ2069539.1 Protein transport protein S9 plasma membrane t-SNARE [Coemansia sp. S155-1]KAJ2113137.1 Protein transport protein S9 plasma membrane t-SNARE [Coemansia sp. RSA 922]KAJ2463136.1 Protein transport protein S9 plasma membrane t-SNARE [Coemansia sp. RSA 2337]
MSSYSRTPAGGSSYGGAAYGSAGSSRNPSSTLSNNNAPRYGSSSVPERQPPPNSSGSRSGKERPYGSGVDGASRPRAGQPPPAIGGGVRGYASAARESRGQYGNSNYRQGQQQYGNEEDDEEDVDAIKARITQVKKETLDSTRNSLRTLEQTEKIGAETLGKLGQQTEQLNRIDRTLEMTNIQAENSIEDTAKLRTLNKSIFHMHVKNPFSGKKRREQELAKLQAEQERERLVDERKTKNDVESRRRVQQFTDPNGLHRYTSPAGRMNANGDIVSTNNMSQSERSRYTFEDEDHEVEDEINDNLGQMSSALGRLKDLSIATRNELKAQEDPLKRIGHTTDKTSDNIGVARYQLGRIK